MVKRNIMGCTLPELEALAVEMGEEPYRGRQLFKWIYNDLVHQFADMTTYTRALRARLDETCTFGALEVKRHLKSSDGTEKFLFGLEDGREIEAVLVDLEDHRAACVSTQVGCALDCRFCATGTMGFTRNLTTGEILAQLVFLRKLHGPECFRNVVFMGMGEPLNNYGNLVAAIGVMTDSLGMGIGAKKIVISTAGVAPAIRKLTDSGSKVRLAVSLNAATQDKRLQIMPIARAFDLDSLMASVRYYAETTGYRVTFEYMLIRGFNDTLDDVLALARLIEGIPCKINLLTYNPVEGLPFERPEDSAVEWFAQQLYPRAPAVTVRKSRGRDIKAACGQLVADTNR
jgi:23S rRNA (adenine2503-C2)-methyltransferase